MPLVLWAFLNIRNGEGSLKDYLVLTLLPLYASIVGFFFFLSAMAVIWLVDVLRGKGWNFRFLFAIGYMTIIFMLVEYRLVYSFLVKGEPNSRDEYVHASLPLWRVLRLALENYVLGHTHVMTVHTLFILPAIYTAFYFVYKKIYGNKRRFLSFYLLSTFCYRFGMLFGSIRDGSH